jgi:hypothetical protein
MEWIDKGYDLVSVTSPPIAREMPKYKSVLENHEFVTKAISDMVEVGAASALPFGVSPTAATLSVSFQSHIRKSCASSST